MSDVKKALMETGIVSICRKIYGEDLALLSDALYAGGVRLMEVTYDQSDPDCISKTSQAISLLQARHPDMFIGAGTVLTREQVKATFDAGGKYVVSPDSNLEIIRYTKELGMCSMPGAMTPTEVLSAYNAGADVVKLFPAASLGVTYVKDIRSPISHVPLMATGGINLENYADFLNAGCCSAGIGSFLSDSKLIKAGDWDTLRDRAKAFLDIFREVTKV